MTWHARLTRGFSLIELLIIIALFGILATIILVGVKRAQLRAHDNSIRSDVGQLRWLAEQVYDTQAASYQNWSGHSSVASQLAALTTDLEKQTLVANPEDAVTIIESQAKEYCISAPLRSDGAKHYCIDATGVFKTVTQACQVPAQPTNPIRCPAS